MRLYPSQMYGRQPSGANRTCGGKAHAIIYVIKSELLEAHKIGVTNDWSRRKRELKVGVTTTAVHVARINDAGSLEQHLHKRFARCRLPQSEWFKLDEDDLALLRSTIRKAKDDYERLLGKRSTGTASLQETRKALTDQSTRNRADMSTRLTRTKEACQIETRSYDQSTAPRSTQIAGQCNSPDNSAEVKRQRRKSIHQSAIFAGCLTWLYAGNFINGSTNTSTAEKVGLIALASPGIIFISIVLSVIASTITTRIHEAISPVQRQ
mgnify:CR=1 FL=1